MSGCWAPLLLWATIVRLGSYSRWEGKWKAVQSAQTCQLHDGLRHGRGKGEVLAVVRGLLQISTVVSSKAAAMSFGLPGIQELEAMKARLKQMEEEAAKLREVQVCRLKLRHLITSMPSCSRTALISLSLLETNLRSACSLPTCWHLYLPS